MGKIFDTRPEKIEEIPPGEPFVRLGRQLQQSDAWSGMPINCWRLINFLIIEHLNHAGKENGNLIATYNQLVQQAGIPRAYIFKAITEAEKRGLIIVEYGARKNYTSSYPNRFKLTFLKFKVINDQGTICYQTPNHQWKKFKCSKGKKRYNKSGVDSSSL